MNKKLFVSLLAGAMTAAMVAGGTIASAEEDFSGVELSFWTAPFGEDDMAFFQEHLADWMERTGATVNIEVIPWDTYEEKYMTGVAGGTGPDVGYMYNEMLYNYIAAGQLEDLDSYFTDEEKEEYIYWQNGQVMGKQYILPYVVGAPRILFANMDILAEAGIDEIPTTWDGLIDTAKTIKEKTGKIGFDQAWGGAFGEMNEVYFPYLWQAGGSICDEEGNLTLDTEEALKAAEFVYSLKEEGILSESCVSRDGNAVMDDFRAGEIGMVVSSSVSAKKTTEAGINWDYVPFTTDVTGGTFVANDSLVLFSSCENKEAAISLMKELTSPDMMMAFHESCYSMPPITKSETYIDDPKFESMYEECADQMHALPVMNNLSQIESSLYANLQMMMMGELTPEQALKDTVDYAASLG